MELSGVHSSQEISYSHDGCPSKRHFTWVLRPPLAPVSRGESIVLRPVESVDGMTARYAPLDFAALARLTPRLLALPSIEAVILDISNKPPATIEWE